MFNEITKKAILEAIKHPGEIDMKMVDAQQARRVLDRLVGYKISPILWDKVRRGLSAGPRAVGGAQAHLRPRARDRSVRRRKSTGTSRRGWPVRMPPEFDARLVRKGDAAAKVRNEAEAKAVLADLERATFVVSSVTHEGAEEARGPAVHHEQAAAGVALPGQEDDDGRAAAVRRHRAAGRGGGGRSHHLHANRLGARGRPGARRSARPHPARSSATRTCPSSRIATR